MVSDGHLSQTKIATEEVGAYLYGIEQLIFVHKHTKRSLSSYACIEEMLTSHSFSQSF